MNKSPKASRKMRARPASAVRSIPHANLLPGQPKPGRRISAPFLSPRKGLSTRISTFNVRSLATDVKLAVLAYTLHQLGISVCGVTDVRRSGSGSISVNYLREPPRRPVPT